MYGPRSGERFNTPFMQRDRFSRFQPTYPYLQQDIHLPPTICLSDGEEPPPYKGPCTLQLRDPEQQLELSRASVRAPPNRTIFDSDLIDVYVHGGGPRPPSSNSGKSASNSHVEGPPPTYSEVMGQTYPGSASFLHQHSNNAPPSNQRTGGRSAQPGASTTLFVKVKEGRRDKPVWLEGAESTRSVARTLWHRLLDFKGVVARLTAHSPCTISKWKSRNQAYKVYFFVLFWFLFLARTWGPCMDVWAPRLNLCSFGFVRSLVFKEKVGLHRWFARETSSVIGLRCFQDLCTKIECHEKCWILGTWHNNDNKKSLRCTYSF